MTSDDTYEGWYTVFFQCLHSKGDSNMAMTFQRFCPKCRKSSKIAQNDQKNTIFNLRQATPHLNGRMVAKMKFVHPWDHEKGVKIALELMT